MTTLITDEALETDSSPRVVAGLAPAVEIMIPVYNEEHVLAASVYRLHRFLSGEIAAALATELSQVGVLALEQKGRGRALRAAWSASRAQVVAYMDVDLSLTPSCWYSLSARACASTRSRSTGSRIRTPAWTSSRPRSAISAAWHGSPAPLPSPGTSRWRRGSSVPGRGHHNVAPTCPSTAKEAE
jgi:Glycosyl transferase family 2